MRSLFIAPSPLEGYVFVNENDEQYLITNDGYILTDIETPDLVQVSFDISVQSVVDNCIGNLQMIQEEIQQAIENFE